MVELCKRMFKKYFEEKKLIPPGNLVETRYEDFIKNPLEEMKCIYSELNLPGFKRSENKFKSYIKSQEKIKTSKYVINEELKNKIYSYFKETIDLWGYKI